MDICKFIAKDCRESQSYGELVEKVMVQMTDPKTGTLMAENVPTLNQAGGDNEGDDNDEWTNAMGKSFQGNY